MSDLAMEWRVIPGFERYEISEFGVIRRLVDSSRATKAGHVITGWIGAQGYRQVTIVPGDKIGKRFAIKKSIHTLVAYAFIGVPVGKMEIAHGDGDRLNNHYTNLRWASSKENKKDMIKHNTVLRGEMHVGAKLSDKIVMLCREKYATKTTTIKNLANESGVCQEVMRKAIAGYTWKHLPNADYDRK